MRRASSVRWLVLSLASVAGLIMSVLSPEMTAANLRQSRFLPTGFVGASSSVACTNGGDPLKPFSLPTGFLQVPIASEPAFPDLADMNTLNETGPQRGRFLYRTHEVRDNGSVTATDLLTGTTRIVAQRADWERLDGILWTPWGTLLAAEEVITAARRDPQYPNAVGGLVYEIDPRTGTSKTLIAVGTRAHEGLQLDKHGHLYGISERAPGYIYRFVPDRKGDLTSGQLYALRIVQDAGDRTGWAAWVPLDRQAVQVDSDAAAAAAGATGYGRPEDLQVGLDNETMYVAITSENRVLAIEAKGEFQGYRIAVVHDYVRAGRNAPADFTAPDNLTIDPLSGDLYISEDPGGGVATGKRQGDDIWVALYDASGPTKAKSTQRFASINDCEAEPTGIYFTSGGRVMFVNVQHRGGDGLDKAMAIVRDGPAVRRILDLIN